MADGDKHSRILHDLRGPLVNVRGFTSEIDTAVASLTDLLDQYQDDLPSAFRVAAATLIKDDFDPCLDFLNRSIEKLSDRVDEFATLMTAEPVD